MTALTIAATALAVITVAGALWGKISWGHATIALAVLLLALGS